jgi:hypothetical protein
MSRKKTSSGSKNPQIRHTEEKAQTLVYTGLEPILLPNLSLM